MTATPIWDKPSDIISIINFLLINDKRTTLKINDIFNNKDEFTPKGIEIFRKKLTAIFLI